MQDDIVVWADTQELHDRRLRLIMDRIRDSGLKLNKSKCVFGAREVSRSNEG